MSDDDNNNTTIITVHNAIYYGGWKRGRLTSVTVAFSRVLSINRRIINILEVIAISTRDKRTAHCFTANCVCEQMFLFKRVTLI